MKMKLHAELITGAQPKAGAGHKMQTVFCRFFNVTLLGIAGSLLLGVPVLKSYPPF